MKAELAHSTVIAIGGVDDTKGKLDDAHLAPVVFSQDDLPVDAPGSHRRKPVAGIVAEDGVLSGRPRLAVRLRAPRTPPQSSRALELCKKRMRAQSSQKLLHTICVKFV
mgnify:CR=1 FL=1